jgi:hypothetical protein
VKQLVLSSAVAVVVAFAIAACNSSGEDELDVYYDQLDGILEDVGERVWGGGPPALGGTSFEDDRAAVANYFAEAGMNTNEIIDEISALNPPTEVQSRHNAYVASVRIFAAVLDDTVSRTASAQSVAEARAAAADPAGDAAIASIESACVDLQVFASERGNDVDLDCDS